MVIGSEQNELELDGQPGDLQILVADDSPVYHKLVQDALFYQPYSTIHAKSGQEALELFRKHSPPIVITDWMMPDLSGLDLCKRIREESHGTYTYVILLTSMSDSESLVKGLEAGADEFLTKPFDPAELQARLGVGRRIAQLHRQVEMRDKQLAETNRVDATTGQMNQNAFRECATWQLKSGADHHFPVWFVVADIDSFASVNERFGRSAGDTVLGEFGRIAKSILMPSDILGRVGDDEFCFVTSHVNREALATTIEHLRLAFASHEFQFANKIVTATASFGALGFEGSDAPDFLTVFRQAEKTLSDSRQAGGNQFRIALLRAPR